MKSTIKAQPKDQMKAQLKSWNLKSKMKAQQDIQETNVRERMINDELKSREVNGVKRIDSEIAMISNPESKLERNNYSDIAQPLDFKLNLGH